MIRAYGLYILLELISSLFFSYSITMLTIQTDSLAATARIVAYFYLCVAIFEIPTGVIADRYGRKFSCIAGIAITAIGFGLVPYASALNLTEIALVTAAFGTTLISGADSAWLLNLFHDRNGTLPSEKHFIRIEILGRISSVAGAFLGLPLLGAGHYFWYALTLVAVLALILGLATPFGTQDRQVIAKNVDRATFRKAISSLGTKPVLILLASFFMGIDMYNRQVLYQPFVLSLTKNDTIYLAIFPSMLSLFRIVGVMLHKLVFSRFQSRVYLLIVALVAQIICNINAWHPIHFCNFL
jgi:MFS family permease